MSLHPQSVHTVSEEIARVARQVFSKGNRYLLLRDELGTLYTDADFASVFSPYGQSTICPWRLALVCVLQFLEDPTDRQAADAVRSRIDWKYVLGLELTDGGFDYSVLSEFRSRLVSGKLEQRLLDRLLEQCKQNGWIKERGNQRTDSTHVLAAIWTLNRCETIGEMLRAALNAIATVASEWYSRECSWSGLSATCRPIEETCLSKGKEARQLYSEQVGRDGMEWNY